MLELLAAFSLGVVVGVTSFIGFGLWWRRRYWGNGR